MAPASTPAQTSTALQPCAVDIPDAVVFTRYAEATSRPVTWGSSKVCQSQCHKANALRVDALLLHP